MTRTLRNSSFGCPGRERLGLWLTLRRENLKTGIDSVYEGTSDGSYVPETRRNYTAVINSVLCDDGWKLGRVVADGAPTSESRSWSSLLGNTVPWQYCNCKILVFLLIYMGTSIYSISRNLLADLKSVRLTASHQHWDSTTEAASLAPSTFDIVHNGSISVILHIF